MLQAQVAFTNMDVSTRRRSLSASSSASSSQGSQDSWSAYSSSFRSLENEDIKTMFLTLDNITINAPIRLELGDCPQQSPPRQRRKRLLTLEDQLNPAATPFVPNSFLPSQPLCSSPEPVVLDALTHDGLYEVISMHSPCNHSGEYVPPPGLSVPTKTAARTTPETSKSSPQPTPLDHPPKYTSDNTPPPPTWYRSFIAGTNPAIDTQIRQFNAHAAVSSNPNWTEDELALFAGQFSSQAYVATENPLNTIAEFASSVFRAFESTYGPISAQSFLWSLRHNALHAFMTSWDSASLDPSLHHNVGLAEHVIGSISIARFIGDLFKGGLLPASLVMKCISKILEAPHSEEHIVALGYLVVRSGPELWVTSKQLNAEAFIAFSQNLKVLASGVRYSLVGGEPGYSVVWVDEMNTRFAEWQACN